eukprot:8404-Eustigmatos_ZCMA.PRE.1
MNILIQSSHDINSTTTVQHVCHVCHDTQVLDAIGDEAHLRSTANAFSTYQECPVKRHSRVR